MNLAMMFSNVTFATIMLMASGVLSTSMGILLLLAPIPVYLIVMRVFKVWGPKTYDLKEAKTAELENLESAHQNS